MSNFVFQYLEIHSELSDWISKSSMGKLQPFRNILLNHKMGQRQHKRLVHSPFVSFQFFRTLPRHTIQLFQMLLLH